MEDLAEAVAQAAEDLIQSAKSIVQASNNPAVQQQVIKSTSKFSVATSQLVDAAKVCIDMALILFKLFFRRIYFF